jgi:oxygen-independent coproporphyrinogen-3 oxidase
MKKLVSLLDKYNIPGGRYTYYPFHRHWNDDITKTEWILNLTEKNPSKVDVYIHIPFCHSLCTFCGCNIKVMKSNCDNDVYIDRIKKEWSYYPKTLKVDTLYLGGGTPNFLTTEEIASLLKTFEFTEAPIISIEIDPRFLDKNDLIEYKKMGITRLSFGIQDFNNVVLENINRKQNEQEILDLLNEAHLIGFESINVDLIYGLSFQTLESFEKTINSFKDCPVTSFSIYPFAKVPWQNNSQKAFGEIQDFTLHDMNEFLSLASERLTFFGFDYIGMGYFSKERIDFDRNIMGFNKRTNEFLIGLGVSAISTSPLGHIQNEKIYVRYLQSIREDSYLIFKSHKKSNAEHLRQEFFKSVILKNKISKSAFELFRLEQTSERLKDILNDEIVHINSESDLVISPVGRFFHKAILQFFDSHFNY